MMSPRLLVSGLLICAVIGAGLMCGCEGNPDTENVGDEFETSPSAGGNRSDATAAEMTVDPAAATVANNGAVASFTVKGASGAATWSVQDISRGSILTQSATAATYQRAAAGDNVVIATDSRGNAAFATVSQP
jgi:hypothetical protein